MYDCTCDIVSFVIFFYNDLEIIAYIKYFYVVEFGKIFKKSIYNVLQNILKLIFKEISNTKYILIHYWQQNLTEKVE